MAVFPGLSSLRKQTDSNANAAVLGSVRGEEQADRTPTSCFSSSGRAQGGSEFKPQLKGGI